MKTFHSIEEYRQSGDPDSVQRTAVTLGKFDGIHIGHRKLIGSIISKAKSDRLQSVVFAIESRDGGILSHDERSGYLESLGVDVLIECPFSKEFMSLGAKEFVRWILTDTLHASYVAVGCDFAFGHNREGNVQTLKDLGSICGFETRILDKEKLLGEDVSSTRVRDAVTEGNMALAAMLLGRPYPIAGEVSHGRHLGSTIDMPTANVVPEPSKILPPDGVYASFTRLADGRVLSGVTNVGVRPTVGGTIRRSETTLLDFNEDLYGTVITTSLIAFLRSERKFSGLEELRDQVAKDTLKAIRILKEAENGNGYCFSEKS